jgi:TolA-binding protein
MSVCIMQTKLQEAREPVSSTTVAASMTLRAKLSAPSAAASGQAARAGVGEGQFTPLTPREDMNTLLQQLQAANSEIAELKASNGALQAREAALKAIVDSRADERQVTMEEHQAALAKNKHLEAQLRQLRMDLELLYIDDQFGSANYGAAGASTDNALAGASGPTGSCMSTVNRLGALLGVSENQTRFFQVCRLQSVN